MEGATLGTRHCAYCKTDKIWLNSGRKLKDGSKIYIDAKQQRWSGRRCPDCEKARVQAAVRCDEFDKEIIARSLEAQGYDLRSKQLPLIVDKGGKKYKVSIRRAFTEGQHIVLEQELDQTADLVALIFESARILTLEQINQLQSKLKIYGDRQLDEPDEKAPFPNQSVLPQKNS